MENKKEEISSALLIDKAAKIAIQKHYNCNGEYPCSERAMCCHCDGTNSSFDCCECGADEYEEGFKAGVIWMSKNK